MFVKLHAPAKVTRGSKGQGHKVVSIGVIRKCLIRAKEYPYQNMKLQTRFLVCRQS